MCLSPKVIRMWIKLSIHDAEHKDYCYYTYSEGEGSELYLWLTKCRWHYFAFMWVSQWFSISSKLCNNTYQEKESENTIFKIVTNIRRYLWILKCMIKAEKATREKNEKNKNRKSFQLNPAMCFFFLITAQKLFSPFSAFSLLHQWIRFEQETLFSGARGWQANSKAHSDAMFEWFWRVNTNFRFIYEMRNFISFHLTTPIINFK